jgi:ribonuclease T2
VAALMERTMSKNPLPLLTTLLLCLVLCMPAAQAKKPKKGAQGGAGFDYYLLSLSWSPEYCKTHPADKQECGITLVQNRL